MGALNWRSLRTNRNKILPFVGENRNLYEVSMEEYEGLSGDVDLWRGTETPNMKDKGKSFY